VPECLNRKGFVRRTVRVLDPSAGAVTEAPADLVQLQKAILKATGLPAAAVGIKGDKKHADKGVSYHLGKDQIKRSKHPYSARLQRDINGLTDAASAIDIGDDWPRGGREAWKRFNNLLVAALRAGDPALVTIRATNFSPDGSERKRADRQKAFRVEGSDDNVDIHTHIEWYRDAGVAAGSDDLVEAILAKLNSKVGLTADDVANAVRAALAEATQDEPEA